MTERQRAEVALTESEARLRGFVEIGSDWLWETDADLRFSYVSSNIGHSGLHAAAVLGRRREELRTGDPIDDDWQAHVEALTAHRPFRDFTYAYRDGEGRRRIAQTSGRPMLGPGGEFRGYRGTGRDVTEEVEARLKLRDSERRFRSLVTNMRDIVFCHGVQGDDAHGYDQGGAELYGADAQRLAGTVDEHGRARIGVWYEAVHPEDRPAYAALERRRKERHEPYALDYRITHPATGELRWMREVAWVVRDEADRRTHFDSYIIDITESKRLEEALRASEERHRRLLEAAPVAILTYAEGLCTFANPVAVRLLAGRDAAELLGRPLDELVAPGDAGRLRAAIEQPPAAGGAAPVEVRCRRLDGSELLVDASAVAVPGDPPAVQLVLVDLTERQRAEALRHQAEHDPLTGLPNRSLLTERLARLVVAAKDGATGLAAADLRPRRVQGGERHARPRGRGRAAAAGGAADQGVVRESDLVARLGGDEFAVLQERARERARRGRAARGGSWPRWSSRSGSRTRRCGSRPASASPAAPATAPRPRSCCATPTWPLPRQGGGRGRLLVLRAAARRGGPRPARAGADLRSAVQHHELRLVYQPQAAMPSGRVVGVEALLRWRSPARGVVSPAEFIPVAELTGLIRPLGAWVLDRACAQARAWAEGAAPAGGRQRLRGPALAGRVRRAGHRRPRPARPRAGAAGPRADREHAGRPPARRRRADAGAAGGAGRADRDRRLRHRLLVAPQPQAPAGPPHQDRPLLRRRRRAGRGQRGDRRPRPSAWPTASARRSSPREWRRKPSTPSWRPSAATRRRATSTAPRTSRPWSRGWRRSPRSQRDDLTDRRAVVQPVEAKVDLVEP